MDLPADFKNGIANLMDGMSNVQPHTAQTAIYAQFSALWKLSAESTNACHFCNSCKPAFQPFRAWLYSRLFKCFIMVIETPIAHLKYELG